MDTNASLRSFSIIFWYQKNIFLSLLLRFFSFSEQCRNLNFYVQGVLVLTRPIAISRVPREQRPTDRRTDQRTVRVAYRVACTRLKTSIKLDRHQQCQIVISSQSPRHFVATPCNFGAISLSFCFNLLATQSQSLCNLVAISLSLWSNVLALCCNLLAAL